jgi:hypothetical protein
VLAAWPLEDLFAVRALDDLTGIALLPYEPNPDYDDRFPALLSDVVRWPARPPRGMGPRPAAAAVPHRAQRQGQPGAIAAGLATQRTAIVLWPHGGRPPDDVL